MEIGDDQPEPEFLAFAELPRIVRFPTPFGNKNLLSLVMHQCTLVAGSDSYLGSAFGQASSAPCSVNRD